MKDLTQYDIELSVDVESLLIQGQEEVRYTNTEHVPLNEVIFRLFPQTPGYGGQMSVDEVSVDGKAANTRLDLMGSALYVSLPQPLDPEETVTFQLDFEATVPEGTEVGYGQFSYADSILALPNAYPLIPVYDDEGWNAELAPAYGDAVYSDVALYRVQVRAPSEQVVVASGSALARVEQGDGTTTTRFVSGPTRDFALMMSADFITSTATVDGTLVTSYYLPQDSKGGKRALSYAADALRVFSERFAPYPYAEFDVVETPTTAGGIEYPGLVVIAQQLYDESGGFFEFATVHETAHQWWYGLVGSDQVDEPWLDEALVQYSTLLYYEEIRGPEVAEGIRERSFEQPYEKLLEESRDAPVGQPVRAFSSKDYGPVVYGKGPLFFQALRDEVGDEAFFAILRAYLKSYRYKIATPEGFLALSERVSGQELDDLYERWILSPNP
ncbi:MAG: M1 family metallopeptidase [Chloroflexota bacterium]|nr:M1 family metallopeptidase [Chloroflexota bacterium]